MIAESVKYKGHSCFKNDWAGFDEIKPINLIIGRNNTGKSHMIDFVRTLCGKGIHEKGWEAYCKGVLDEKSLRSFFSERTEGGELGGNHWTNHGMHLINRTVTWRISTRGEVEQLDVSPHKDDVRLPERALAARRKQIEMLLKETQSRLSNSSFHHLLADRDIQPESLGNSLSLSENGAGATNIIRRYIQSSKLPRELVDVELRNSLNDIFRTDGQFSEIAVQLHDEADGRNSKHLDKWEVFLEEDSKGLVSLSRSGSGLKTVILVLLNLIVVPDMEQRERKGSSRGSYVFAFEELENNLHPSLLRRLLQFLAVYAIRKGAKIFLTSHSSVALDLFANSLDAQIIHVRHDGESASTQTISAHFDRCGILSELGARPSDLLQANGVLWLEGPSDRIYVNRFLELFSDGQLVEGKDYQCAFYGGSILASSQFTAPEEGSTELANLLRLNGNIAVICDGDRTSEEGENSEFKVRVQRVEAEVHKVPESHIWVTEPKEIENYIPGSVWSEVFSKPGLRDPSKIEAFSTYVADVLDRATFDKVKSAIATVPLLKKEMLLSRFDLAEQMTSLIETIRKWNS